MRTPLLVGQTNRVESEKVKRSQRNWATRRGNCRDSRNNCENIVKKLANTVKKATKYKNVPLVISALPLCTLKLWFLHISTYLSICSSHLWWLHIDFRHSFTDTQYCDSYLKDFLAVSRASQVLHTSSYCYEQLAVLHCYLYNILHSRDICVIAFTLVSQALEHTYYSNIFAASKCSPSECFI